MATNAAFYQTNTPPRPGKDRTSHITNKKTDLGQSLRISTINRRPRRQDTILIRLVLASFMIMFSNTFIRPLTAGHIPNWDQHSNLDLNSSENAETGGLKLQSRYYDHQRQRMAAENFGLTLKDPNNESFIINDPDDQLNCTPRAVEQFPDNFMSPEFARRGGVTFNILISMYMFLGLAIVCDDYFVSSLVQLRDVLNISPDISGATFMAIGSSMPELFTSIIGVLIAQSDVGVGTIAGSAIFNLLFIMGCCAFASSVSLVMPWWPVFRDTFSYIIAILALVIVLLDERIYWYEALSMLILYCMYILMLGFNKPLESKMREVVNGVLRHYRDSSDEKQPLIDSSELPSSSYRTRNAVEASTEAYDPKKSHVGKTSYASVGQASTSQIEEDELNSDTDEVNFQGTLAYPETVTWKIFWFIMLPLKLAFYLTIPDSRRPSCHRFCVCTFMLSILWIGILSYVMVWMATVAGDALNIPDTVIGFTILAAGTGIPDCFASYFVAKEGHGDMAYANSVGSNIFDVLICLGIPWLIQASVREEGVVVHSRGLTYSILILLIVMFLFYASLMINDWSMTHAHGYFYLGLYVVILIIVCLYEMNYFGPLNPPPCPR